MTAQDIILMAITAYRENRGAGQAGLQSVLNVIQNRAAKHGESPYAVCTQHAQFSSISMPGPESYLWPVEADPQWHLALLLANEAASGTLEDITGGATSYYAQTIAPPYWAESMQQTVTIGGQIFFR